MRHPSQRAMSPSAVVVQRVAEATGRDPMDLAPLAGTIDPDAVDRLFAGRNGSGSVELTVEYEGCLVGIDHEGVTVELGTHGAGDWDPDTITGP